jgi:outer membrane receptor protein involved in Fe transport
MKLCIALVAIAFVCIAPLGQAQTATDSVDYYMLSLEELMNIPITTASKFEQTVKDAPSSISLITRDQIIKYGWLSGNNVLFRLPGFSPSQDYDRTTVSSRGIYEGWNNNHMLLLMDGVPMNDNMYGTAFTWEITPLVFTKSIEVIRGPGSALYGSNATNGLISYNTLSAKDLTKQAEVRLRAGSVGTTIFDVLTGHENESVSFVSAFNFYNTKGFNYNSYDASGTDQHQIRNDRSSFYFFQKIEAKGKLQGLSLQYHEQGWSYATGHGWLFYVPDRPEDMNESRRLVSLRYKTPDQSKKFTQEYLVRFQRHGVSWNSRLFPDNAGGYPFGLTEVLKTHTSDVFSRAQLSYRTDNNSVILGGLENSVFFYRGDALHQSNANLNGDFSPTPNNQMINVGDYFATLGNNPFMNSGLFAQYTSQKIADLVLVTAGARYDYASFKYYPSLASVATQSKSFSKFNPRISVVFSPNSKFSLKLMGGRAFRTPAASELFGSNTFLLASNTSALRPEVITTFEAGTDYSIIKNLNWRLNVFHTRFDDQIAYSVSNFNLSTNLYSLTTVGVENEFTFQAGRFDGFLNHSFAKRTNESIVDPTITVSKSTLTWVPMNVVNAGMKLNEPRYFVSLQGHYQGQVNRRISDSDATSDQLRGLSVKSWATLDARVVYKVKDMLEIGLTATNLTGSKGMLLKNNLYAFDYRIPGRSLLLDIRIML